MDMKEFTRLISSRKLKARQMANLSKMKIISEKFHREAGTYDEVKEVFEREITEDTIVLESGHQPNFFPYAGVWKKAFLLAFFDNMLAEYGRESIPLFGFFDYNLCTARFLYKNRIPFARKGGYDAIGFKISREEQWKRFNAIDKPPEDEWSKEIERIKGIYRKAMEEAKEGIGAVEEEREYLNMLEEEMWKSYELADKFSDVNAFIFSRICNRIMGLKVIFFRYSDVQSAKIFIDEWERVISDIERYNSMHNEIVRRRCLEDIGYCDVNSIPFWYHCDCGGKVPLYLSGDKWVGECPVCHKKEEIDKNLSEIFSRVSPRAVLRNLVFSEGLGTSLFISGAGGGLRYGIISNEISRAMGLNLPITLVWSGKDYYLGAVHRAVLKQLCSFFFMDYEDILSEERAVLKVQERRNSFADEIKNGEEDVIRRYSGLYLFSDTLLKIAKDVFSIIPSAFDLFVAVGPRRILDMWHKTLEDYEIREGEFYRIEKDVVYDENIVHIYETIKRIGGRSEEIDPLGMFNKHQSKG